MAIPTGLLRFVRDDDELAIAIAHQMGHQILGSFRNIEDEPRADALGIAIAHRAAFDVAKAPAFWDRVAVDQFWQISADMDRNVPYVLHGAMSLRAPAIRRAVSEAVGADRD
jgi:predicted Zn-dependent protease